MAFDGLTVASIVSQMKKNILGGRIYKISQPEVDELCIIFKNKKEEGNMTYRLVVSADASLPIVYFTEKQKENPAVAPNFCMLLRKHIGNGRVVSINQPGFERIIEMEIEHLDEMGDLCLKKLIIEIMGKHSNIIFADANGMIIDSIKHVSHMVSSVREVLPGRTYAYPPAKDKVDPRTVDVNFFMNHILTKPLSVSKAIYTTCTGISPQLANEIVYRANVDGSANKDALSLKEKENIYKAFDMVMQAVLHDEFEPCIAYKGYEPKEFCAIKLISYGEVKDNLPNAKDSGVKLYDDMSEAVYDYYAKKTVVSRIKQRSTDLRKIVSNAVTRTSKKYDLQLSQLKDTEKRDKYKVYGELLTTYAYSISQNTKELTCENYYTNEEITIPLDETISAIENAKKYFAKYNKLKRTYEALIELVEQSKNELDYLLSVQNSLEIADSESDLREIKEELVEAGYVKSRYGKNKNKKEKKSKPLHYVSSDGYHVYVGKNNYQNDELSFSFAQGNDMWFHAKQMPGSHVILKTKGDTDIPDATYEEAARLAAYYSSGRDAKKVEVDYTLKKNLKKPPKANPGFVIYHTNYSMAIEPDIHGITEELD